MIQVNAIKGSEEIECKVRGDIPTICSETAFLIDQLKATFAEKLGSAKALEVLKMAIDRGLENGNPS